MGQWLEHVHPKDKVVGLSPARANFLPGFKNP